MPSIFGAALSLSADGTTLAVGAPFEDSAALGVGGDQGNNAAGNSGAVYVFTLDASRTWAQQAYVKASNTDAFEFFGNALSLSADGATLAVGAYREDSEATGVDGDLDNNAARNSGAVYLYLPSPRALPAPRGALAPGTSSCPSLALASLGPLTHPSPCPLTFALASSPSAIDDLVISSLARSSDLDVAIGVLRPEAGARALDLVSLRACLCR